MNNVKQIPVFLSESSFEYDVRSLLRAFFPHTEIVFVKSLSNVFDDDKEESPVRLFLLFSAHSLYLSWDNKSRIVHSVSGLDRPSTKNVLKLTIYDIISRSEGRTLPWGTLTGIRPVRLALQNIRNGSGRERVRAFMHNHYRTSVEKADLAYDIACREETIIRTFDADRSYCLYVGIPFCPSICLYCSFSSYPIRVYRDRVEAYFKALFAELDFVADAFADRPLSAIYIGGGTPTAVTADWLSALLEKIADRFDLSHLKEWTVEAGRPDSITMEKLSAIRSFGDLRISINPQTFWQKTLDTIGRRHTTEDAKRAFSMAREVGFSHINMDLIVGLPGEGEREVRHTLDEVMALRPDNLTVHSLALKRASRLKEEWEHYGEISFQQSEHIMNLVFDATKQMAMRPYYLYRQKDIAGNLENIGFAPDGQEGIYNILIMEEVQDIVACGAGAISKRVGTMNLPGRVSGVADQATGSMAAASKRPLKTKRAANVKDVEQYTTRIEEMIGRKRGLFGVEEGNSDRLAGIKRADMDDREQIRNAYKKMYDGMIAKDEGMLDDVLDDGFVLVHMTGMRQSKAEFIKAVLNGTLNYFSAEHEHMSVEISGDAAVITGQSYVAAAVFGGGRSNWPLQQKCSVKKVDSEWKITRSVASTY